MKEPDIQDAFVEINDIRNRLVQLEDQSVVFNNTIIALAILANIKPTGFKYITPEDFKDFVKKTMQPFARVVMGTAQEANKLIIEEEKLKNDSSKEASVEDSSEKANEG